MNNLYILDIFRDFSKIPVSGFTLNLSPRNLYNIPTFSEFNKTFLGYYISRDELNDAVRFVIRDLENFRDFPELFWQFIIIILLFKLPLIILSPPPLSLIAKVPQFLKNFTILSFTMALVAHIRPYSYMYCASHRDGVLQILPPLEHFVLEMNKLNSKERKIPH